MVIQYEYDIQAMLKLADVGAGSQNPVLRRSALETLKETSRTFFIPISRLPDGLLEAVGSGYLCLRAIDEIEDHADLDCHTKARLLHNISRTIQSSGERLRVEDLLVTAEEFRPRLPQVSVRLAEWMVLAPEGIAHRVWDATATMADRMAGWAEDGFKVHSEADLDRYTMGVAGAVGLMLSDLWAWYDGTQTNRCNAIGFGRGLQAVNILRNHEEDLRRGADFFPDGWDAARMYSYARRNLALADAYLDELSQGPALEFCRMPLLLAYATIDALEQGRPKLARSEVLRLLGLEGS
jgi:farnesyl-diphosphate farnesyltransferase